MIPPLTKEEFDRLVPDWAKPLAAAGCPLALSLPVYDVLYGTKYNNNPFGLVESISRDGKHVRICERVPGTMDKVERGSLALTIPNYYVPDVTMPEGVEHVRKWQAGELPPFEPTLPPRPSKLDMAGMNSIDRAALGLFGQNDESACLPVEALVGLYTSGNDQRPVDLAVEFTALALGAENFDLLQAGWRTVDLTKVSIAVMLGLLAGSHLVRPSALLPERPAFVAACEAECARRGEAPERIQRLFQGLR